MVPFEFTDRSRDSRNTRIISGLFISFFLSPQSSIFFPSFFRRNENTERKEKRRGNFNRFKEFTTSVRKLTSPTSSSRDLQLHRNRINSIPIEIRLSRISQIHFHFVQGFASPSPSVITPPTIAETRTVYQRERIEIRVMQRAMRAQLAAASFASRRRILLFSYRTAFHAWRVCRQIERMILAEMRFIAAFHGDPIVPFEIETHLDPG